MSPPAALKVSARSLRVAWSPSQSHQLACISTDATGEDFSINSSFEILKYDFSEINNREMISLASYDCKFPVSSLAWGGGVKSYIAVGSSEGQVALVDSGEVLAHSNTSTSYETNSHSFRPVNSIQFHPNLETSLASGGDDGSCLVYDIQNIQHPTTYAPSDNLYSDPIVEVAWNIGVQHIIGASTSSGITLVWDLRARKELMKLQDSQGRSKVSALAWSPLCATQVVVAYEDEQTPGFQIWDLRNVRTPWKEAFGHTGGVTSLTWSPHDRHVFASSGRDSKVLTWALSSNEVRVISEFNTSTSCHEVRFSPVSVGILSCASEELGIYVPLQHQTSLNYCPEWVLPSKMGCCFGFGGRLAEFGGTQKPTEVRLKFFLTEPEILNEADQFENYLAKNNFKLYCSEKAEISTEHEKLEWELLGRLFENSETQESREILCAKLGFDRELISKRAEQVFGKKPSFLRSNDEPEEPPPEDPVNELDSLTAENFFTDLARQSDPAEEKVVPRESRQEKTGIESLVKDALVIGDLTSAVELCIKSGCMAEALVLASGGDPELFRKTRDYYMKSLNDPFMNTVRRIMSNKFDKLIMESNLDNWKETLAILITHANDPDPSKYRNLYQILAKRLENEKFDLQAACICYLAVGDFEGTLDSWQKMSKVEKTKLELQSKVQRMMILQAATRYSGHVDYFSEKLSKYAELLANSGRISSAVRYLLLCSADDSGPATILKDRIFHNSRNTHELNMRPPRFPFNLISVCKKRPGFVPQQSSQPASTFQRPSPPAFLSNVPPLISESILPQDNNTTSGQTEMIESKAPPRILKHAVMNPADQSRIESAFLALLNRVQEPNRRKYEANQKRILELLQNLKEGRVRESTQETILLMGQAIQSEDFESLQKLHLKLLTSDWEANKNWLMAVRRLF